MSNLNRRPRPLLKVDPDLPVLLRKSKFGKSSQVLEKTEFSPETRKRDESSQVNAVKKDLWTPRASGHVVNANKPTNHAKGVIETIEDLQTTIHSLERRLNTFEKVAKSTPHVSEYPSRVGTTQKSETNQAAIPKRNGKKGSRKAKIISDVLFYLAIFTLLVFAIAFAQTNSDKQVFGYRFYNILTTSMQSKYPQGTMVIAKSVDPNEIVVGDDITFYKDANTTVTHQVIDIIENYNGTGKRGFRTKGIENPMADKEIVLAANVAGVVQSSVPHIGGVFKTISGNLPAVFMLFGALIAFSFSIQHFLGLKQSKKEVTV